MLPSEAEWGICLSCTTTSFNWGNEIDETKANYSGSGIGQTVDVGQYSPNNWGFYDMHGNVREWTADIYMDYPSSPQIDPTGGISGDGRVTRGGDYGSVGGIRLLSIEIVGTFHTDMAVLVSDLLYLLTILLLT